MKYFNYKTVLLIASFSILNALLTSTVSAEQKDVTVVLSGDSLPYQTTLKGFQDELETKKLDVNVTVLSLEGQKDNVNDVIEQVKLNDSDVIFTLGRMATKASVDSESETPIVASMVMNSVTLDKAANATGVVLNHSMGTQLDWVKKVLPKAKRIGILYNPVQNQAKIDATRKLARARGLTLVAIEVAHPRDLPRALKRLSREVDVLLGISDRVVMSKKTSEQILLTSFRNRIPFIGLSNNWVKAGALYALGWEYEDLGKQSAELTEKIVNGEDVSNLSVQNARKVTYSLNKKTIEHMNLKMDSAFLSNAARVF